VERVVAQSFEDCGGGLHAEVAREQRRFELLERAFVHDARQGGQVGDFGRERFARARDRLPHFVEEALRAPRPAFRRVYPGVRPVRLAFLSFR